MQTVQSLIEELSKYPGNLPVFVSDGYAICAKLELSRVTYDADLDYRAEPEKVDYLQITFDV